MRGERRPGGIDRVRSPNLFGEENRNRASAKATWLLRKIVGYLGSQRFTLEEVKEAFDALTDQPQVFSEDDENNRLTMRGAQKYGQGHLDILLKRGFIEKNDDGSYHVTTIGIEHAERDREDQWGNED